MEDDEESCGKNAGEVEGDSNMVSWHCIPVSFTGSCTAGCALHVAENAIKGKKLKTSKAEAHYSTCEDEIYGNQYAVTWLWIGYLTENKIVAFCKADGVVNWASHFDKRICWGWVGVTMSSLQYESVVDNNQNEHKVY